MGIKTYIKNTATKTNSHIKEYYATGNVHWVDITFKATDQSKSYDGTKLDANNTYSITSGSLFTGHTATVTCSGSTGTNVAAGSSATKTITNIVIKDSSSVDVTGLYNITTVNGTLTINKAASTLPTTWSGASVEYEQGTATVTATGYSGGTIYYATASSSGGTYSSWTTTKPTRTAVGDTYVKCYIKGDANHNDSSVSSEVSISVYKADDARVTVTTTARTYSGAGQVLASVASGDAHGISHYYLGFGANASTAPTSWTTDNSISQTNAGTYYIWYKFDPDSSHSNTKAATYVGSVTISQRSVTATITASANSFVYGATAPTYTTGTATTTTTTGLVNGHTATVEISGYPTSSSSVANSPYTVTATITAIKDANNNSVIAQYSLYNATCQVSVTKANGKATPNTTTPSYVSPNTGTIVIPTQNSSLTYSGDPQSPSWNYDSTYVTILTGTGDTASATNAGSYTQTASLKNIAYFSQGTTTVTVSVYENATVTASSSDISVATVSVGSTSNNSATVTITCKKVTGSTPVTITLNAAATTNYKSASQNISLSVANGVYAWTDGTTTNKTINWTIGQQAITYKATDQSKAYDGEILSADNTITLISGSLVKEAHKATGSCTGVTASANAGATATKTLSSVTIMSGSTNVTANYRITKQNGTLTIAKAASAYTAPTLNASTLTYNGSGQNLVTLGSTSDGQFSFSINGGPYGANIQGTNAGNYTVYWKLTGDANHNNVGPVDLGTKIINKRNVYFSSLVEMAKIDSSHLYLIWNNTDQNTTTGGNVTTGGTLYYYQGTSPNTPVWNNGAGWTTSRPTAKEVGNYYVWVYAYVSDLNNNQGRSGDLWEINSVIYVGTVEIKKREISLTWGTLEFDYNGTAKTVSKPTVGNLITGFAADVTLSGDTQTNAGSYTATASFTSGSDTNHYALPSNKSVTWVIHGTQITYTAPTNSRPDYTGSAQYLCTTGTVSTGGTIYYGTGSSSSSQPSSWSTTRPSATNCGTNYYVWYKITVDSNHVGAVDPTYVGDTSYINKINIENFVAPTASTPDYTGSAQYLCTTGSANGGTIYYTTGSNGSTAPTSGWSTTRPSAIDCGTDYYVWYKVNGDGNHNSISAAYVGSKAYIKPLTASITFSSTEATIETQATCDISNYITGKTPNATLTYAIKSSTTTETSSISGSTVTAGTMSSSSDSNQCIIVTITNPGDDNYAAHSEDFTIYVKKKSRTITFNNNTTAIALNGTCDISATCSPTADISYSTTGVYTSLNASTKVLTGTVISGNNYDTIKASVASTNVYKYQEKTRSIYVGKAQQNWTIAGLSDELAVGDIVDYSIIGTTYGTLTTATLSDTTYATLSGTTIIISNGISSTVPKGVSTTLTITYSGNDTYEERTQTKTIYLYSRAMASQSNTLTYNGTEQTATFNMTGCQLSITSPGNKATSAGNYVAHFVIKNDNNYNYRFANGDGYAEFGWYIIPLATTIWGNTAIVTYNGSAYTISGGNASVLAANQTLYSVNGTVSRTNAGSSYYTPSNAVITDSGGNNVTYNYSITYMPNSGSITVNKKPLTVTDPAAVANLNYNGNAQTLINAGSYTEAVGTPSSTNGGYFEYKLSTSSTWSTSLPTATDIGGYTVNWRFIPSANYSAENSSGDVSSAYIYWKLVVDMQNYVTGWRYKIDSGSWVNKTADATITNIQKASYVTIEGTSKEDATGYNYGSYTYGGSNRSDNVYGNGAMTENITNATISCTKTTNTYSITLNKNNSDTSGSSAGSCTATYGNSSLTNWSAATRTGYTCNGYYTSTSGGTKVINADGTLVASVSNYTNASGQWIKDGTATLYAQWTINTYTITFIRQYRPATGHQTLGTAVEDTSIGVASVEVEHGGSYSQTFSKTNYESQTISNDYVTEDETIEVTLTPVKYNLSISGSNWQFGSEPRYPVSGWYKSTNYTSANKISWMYHGFTARLKAQPKVHYGYQNGTQWYYSGRPYTTSVTSAAMDFSTSASAISYTTKCTLANATVRVSTSGTGGYSTYSTSLSKTYNELYTNNPNIYVQVRPKSKYDLTINGVRYYYTSNYSKALFGTSYFVQGNQFSFDDQNKLATCELSTTTYPIQPITYTISAEAAFAQCWVSLNDTNYQDTIDLQYIGNEGTTIFFREEPDEYCKLVIGSTSLYPNSYHYDSTSFSNFDFSDSTKQAVYDGLPSAEEIVFTWTVQSANSSYVYYNTTGSPTSATTINMTFSEAQDAKIYCKINPSSYYYCNSTSNYYGNPYYFYLTRAHFSFNSTNATAIYTKNCQPFTYTCKPATVVGGAVSWNPTTITQGQSSTYIITANTGYTRPSTYTGTIAWSSFYKSTSIADGDATYSSLANCTINSYTVTVTINTGVNKIYYRSGTSGSWTSTTTSKTFTAQYNSTVQWYAEPTSGYAVTNGGSANTPNSLTVNTSGNTIAPTATVSNTCTVSWTIPNGCNIWSSTSSTATSGNSSGHSYTSGNVVYIFCKIMDGGNPYLIPMHAGQPSNYDITWSVYSGQLKGGRNTTFRAAVRLNNGNLTLQSFSIYSSSPTIAAPTALNSGSYQTSLTIKNNCSTAVIGTDLLYTNGYGWDTLYNINIPGNSTYYLGGLASGETYTFKFVNLTYYDWDWGNTAEGTGYTADPITETS